VRLTGAQRGSLTGGTWLIGLGVVFLVQSAMDLAWTQAWPLFVILVGIASLVSTVIDWRPGRSGLWSLTWPVVWILVGVVLFLSTTGQLGTGPGELIAQWWPWLLVGLGVWFLIGAIVPGRPPEETLAIPLRGAPLATVRMRFSAGSLSVGPAGPGDLVDGEFRGGVLHRELGPGNVELEQDTSYGLPWLNHDGTWTVGVTGEVPLDLRLEGGASNGHLDLRETRLRRLELKTGASETTVVLPRAAGATDVRADAGAASLTFIVPTGVAARVRSKVGLGSTQVDEARFPRMGDGYQSQDYATAENRVDLDIQGGVGSVRVRGEG
jgi:Cell wall-active antibiotics response 4TMS YvqF